MLLRIDAARRRGVRGGRDAGVDRRSRARRCHSRPARAPLRRRGTARRCWRCTASPATASVSGGWPRRGFPSGGWWRPTCVATAGRPGIRPGTPSGCRPTAGDARRRGHRARPTCSATPSAGCSAHPAGAAGARPCRAGSCCSTRPSALPLPKTPWRPRRTRAMTTAGRAIRRARERRDRLLPEHARTVRGRGPGGGARAGRRTAAFAFASCARPRSPPGARWRRRRRRWPATPASCCWCRRLRRLRHRHVREALRGDLGERFTERPVEAGTWSTGRRSRRRFLDASAVPCRRIDVPPRAGLR